MKYIDTRKRGVIPGIIPPADGVTNLETMRLAYLKANRTDPDFTPEEYCACIQAYLVDDIPEERMYRFISDRRHGALARYLS